MRNFLSLFLLLAFARPVQAQYVRPDAVALSVDAPTPDSLSFLLTRGFTEDRDKVRAIFRWITANIRYRLRREERHEKAKPANDDTLYDGRPADERAAYALLKSREGVCEGYARLFNTLCRHAGIRSQLVRGYVRNDSDPTNRPFVSNHSWNAVWLDSSWQLLDATWASGYVRSGSSEFTPSLDEFYYLTPPAEFARNHLPEDPDWSLLANPPVLSEFRFAPFRGQAAQKYRLQRTSPAKGILKAAAGDTLYLELTLEEPLHPERYVLPLEPEHRPDTVLRGAVRLDPLTALPARVLRYEYRVRPGDEWLLLQCNGETILRYKVEGPAHDLMATGNE